MRCEACRSIEYGGGEYRGQPICHKCVKDWQKLDKIIGRETTFEEFLDPILSGFNKLKEKPIMKITPAVNLCLGILVQAKKDHDAIWKEFKETSFYNKGKSDCDSFQVASWVGDYLTQLMENPLEMG